MHTIYKRLLAFHRHELCHAAVCQKHELLDKPVGLLGNLLVYIYRTALLIHLDLHLRTLETDGSGCESLLAELGCKAIELLSLRTMAKARYDTENLGHYGLAFKYYTHFTSPIRRYPDMMVHRLLARYLAAGDNVKQESIDKLCKHCSQREVIAAEAERASIKYKLVEFMQDKVGYVFGGHVSGLTEWGMYVEVEPTKIEGMVPLRDIKGDYFEFDADHYRLVGKRSRVVYNLGDPVRIRVKKTNLEQKLLDYELIETGEEDRLNDRLEYEQGRGTSFIKGEDGSFDNVTV